MSIEYRPSKFINISKLLDGEMDLLRSSIEQSHGSIWLFVHPFYRMDDPFYSPYWESMSRHETEVLKTLRGSEIPIFIFEQRDLIKFTSAKLFGINNKVPICFIPTWHDNPTPWISDTHDLSANDWPIVIDALKQLGAQNCYLGGRIRERYCHADEYHGCVAEAHRRLTVSGFNIIPTRLCFPNDFLPPNV